MVAINPANGPIPKPTKRPKRPRNALSRGGKKPKEAGRRYEKSFADKYGFKRQLGSGAFGATDPALQGDVIGNIGPIGLLVEAKSWNKVDGRGEKVVSFPVSLLDKISKEAAQLGRAPIFLYHVKNASDEWAVVRFDWLFDTIKELTDQNAMLTEQLEEALNAVNDED